MPDTDARSFAERIRERYPEGLTGIFAVGGTRTTFILGHNRESDNPGQIADFDAYANAMLARYNQLIEMFLALGGQHMIIPILAYQRFQEHGDEYTRLISEQTLQLTSPQQREFYAAHNIDPYFVGIDTLLHLPAEHVGHQLARALTDFQNNWSYQEGRHKVIWEIAPIPLFSIWKAHQTLDAEQQALIESQLNATTDLDAVYKLLYDHYARAVYGTSLPMPHFYVGTNRNGDFKLRALLPISLLCGGAFRLFFTPYPTLFITQETLQTILEDLAFGKALRSKRKDYSGQYSQKLADKEYQRIVSLSADAETTLGLIREVEDES